MHYGNIPGVSKPISRLVQGTATFCTPELLDLALEYGFNTFDTGHIYGQKLSVLFGQWIQDRGVRDQVVILSKGAHPQGERNRVTPEDIASDIRDNLEWMGTDHLDLFVLHRDDPTVPVGPIVESLNEHQQAGQIGAFGGSNWTHARLQEANDYARAHGLTPFAVSSPNFSLAEQVEEPWSNCVSISGPQGEEARRFYAQSDLALMPWSSLAGGFFSDRFRRDNLEQLAAEGGFAKLCIRCYCYEQNFQRLDRARELAQAKNVSVAQVALAFVMGHPMNTFALISCADRPQFQANVAALDLKLTPQEMAYLDLLADAPEDPSPRRQAADPLPRRGEG